MFRVLPPRENMSGDLNSYHDDGGKVKREAVTTQSLLMHGRRRTRSHWFLRMTASGVTSGPSGRERRGPYLLVTENVRLDAKQSDRSGATYQRERNTTNLTATAGSQLGDEFGRPERIVAVHDQ